MFLDYCWVARLLLQYDIAQRYVFHSDSCNVLGQKMTKKEAKHTHRATTITNKIAGQCTHTLRMQNYTFSQCIYCQCKHHGPCFCLRCRCCVYLPHCSNAKLFIWRHFHASMRCRHSTHAYETSLKMTRQAKTICRTISQRQQPL